MAAPWSCAVTPSWGPSKSSWSSNSSSICRRNHHHASPRQQRRFPSHPTPCSGDFRDASVDIAHFFTPVEKVGLTALGCHNERDHRKRHDHRAGVVDAERERNWLWRMKDKLDYFRNVRPVQGRINVKAYEIATTLDLRSWAKVLPEIIDRHGALDPEELRYLIKTLRENA